jgi:uncharacterized protein YjbI with pentapeptide repeats
MSEKTVVRHRIPMSQEELDAALKRHELYRAGRPGGQRALLSYRDLSRLDLRMKDLTDADLTAADLSEARCASTNFTGAALFGANFAKADLRGAKLIRADLRGASLRAADLTGADLFDADLRDGTIAQRTRDGDLKTVVVDSAASDLVGARMVNANLSQAKLSGAIAQHTDFTDSLMRNCKLVRADLRNAVMDGVNLEGADLSGADLRGASLKNAILTDADMSLVETAGADMTGMMTDKVVGKSISMLDESIELLIHKHTLFVTSAGAEGKPLDVSDFDLRKTHGWVGAKLTMLKANRAILVGMDLEGAALQAVQFEGADLRSCRLVRADLRGANLTGARLNFADLRECRTAAGRSARHRPAGCAASCGRSA